MPHPSPTQESLSTNQDPAAEPLPAPVTLARIKDDPRLAGMVLVRNSRLSVQPVTDEEWKIVLELAREAAEG